MSTLGLGLHSALAPMAIPGSSSFYTPTTFTDTISETVAVATTDAETVTFGATVAELLALVDATVENFAYNVTASATLAVSLAALEAVRAQPATAAETLSLTEALVWTPGVIVAEQLGWLDATLANQVAQLTAAEALSLTETLAAGWPATISETVTLAQTETVQQALLVLEALGIAPALTPSLVSGYTVSETVSLADTLASFFGANISEVLGLAETWSAIKSAPATIAETIALADSQTATLALRVTLDETVAFDDSQLLNAIYAGTLTEDIAIAGAFVTGAGSGPGTITTWAMNARTKAVSEYDNYAFNSFARLGNRYIAASPTGLYELTGETDDGSEIIADIKSGFAQFAGTRHTLFKGIYLGLRGTGDWVLRLTTGDGQTYTYAVTAADMRSTKVHLGKGLRARYFAFELISTGQDFDLDSVEFVPLVAQRRV